MTAIAQASSHRRPASPVSHAALKQCVDAVGAAADGVRDALATMAAAMVDAWDVGGRRFTVADIAALQPHIFEQLDRQPWFDSAGYVMSEPALADQPRHLEWWRRDQRYSYLPLVLTVEPGAPDCYDYYTMEWFLAALNEQRRFASGPKIDLPCADVYIITFSYPVIAGGEVLGVAAADVALSRYESQVRPPLQQIAAPTVLLNGERRVITSNDPAWTTGEKFRELPVVANPEWQAVEAVTDELGWILAVGCAPQP